MAESTPGAGSARLALKIFLVALVAALVVAATWAFVHWSLEAGTERPAAVSVSRGWGAFSAEQADRYDRLGLTARVLAAEESLRQVLRDGAPQAGPAEGAATGEALADLLAQRRDDLGYDFAYVLDGDGAVVATTEGAELAGADLSGRGLVARGLEDGAGRGAWTRRDGRLAHAALEWVAPDFELLGYVVVGLDLDDVLALQLERTTGADVAFLAPVAGSSPGEGAARGRAVGASLDPGVAESLAAELAEDGIRSVAEPGESRRVAVGGSGGEVYDALIAPLRDASGDALGAVVVAAPADAGGRVTDLPWILGALGAALVLALLFAALLARSILSPVGRLAGMVKAAPQEGFARRPEPRRAGHLAPLAAALRRLFRDLQEERTLSATAAATAAAEAGSPGADSEPEVDKPTLVGVDLRRYARLDTDVGGVRDTADRLRRDETRVRSLVAAHGGRLAGGAGHRLLAAFDGDDAAWRGVTAGAAILTALGEKDSAFDEGDPPAVAVAAGRIAHGSGSAGRPFLVGPAVQLIESLLREASPGELLMARPVHRAVGEELEEAGVAAGEMGGILSPQTLFVLDREAAAKLTSAADAGPVAGTPVPGEIIEGRFEILADRGGSSAGTLFLARDREMDREVALKRLVTTETAGTGIGGGEAGGNGNRAGLLAAVRRLNHPNVAEVHALREVSGDGLGEASSITSELDGDAAGPAPGSAVLLAREWVAGAPLVVGRNLPLPATLGLARQLAAALAAIHGVGLVHGRLKPENVILVPGVGVRVTDLGVGIVAGSSLSASAGDRLRAPEQALDRLGDARSDVYAFGALLARLASGRWWSGEGAVASDGPEEQGGAGLPEDLVALLRRCLAPTPDARPADGEELSVALERVTA